eukprot:CAMPEP_0202867978 /NCGR_PEP_ID=MMETSP1391-20130828/9902_1 /ASSEMBLY_ACC=CAM_ASM_000867 /TAXON_ID=1034604 /ORGANISM="Chlamydomonas leiostraca, Strain SAG 11-49" /LENGTH=386 /DNA_ID=CAMNT_0049548071 /DNA_START=29 /DNA_END=1189 /DNA_ORIENTATION=-
MLQQRGSSLLGQGRAQNPHSRRSVIANAAATKLKAAERVKLGDSDLMVSLCCLGTMTWGQQNTEKEAHEQLSYAWDMGINFMDTAEMYPVPTKAETQGLTDKYIGSWMKGRKRDSIVLASKISGYSERTTWVRDPPRTTRVTREQIKESVDASLKRLGTDHIDLLQIHWPDRYVPLFGGGAYDAAQERQGDVPFEEQLQGMEDVIKAGKVRWIGVSNETSYGVCEFSWLAKTKGLPKIVSIQNSYSLLVRDKFEHDLAETCRRHNVGLLAYSPLAGGSLSGKYNRESVDPKARLNLFPGYMERYGKSMVKEAVAEYEKIAKKHGMTPSELALAWCKSRWFVASTIIGATTLAQLKEDILAFDKDISPECAADIAAVHKRWRDPTIM